MEPLTYSSCNRLLSQMDDDAEHALFNAESSSGSHSPHDHHSSATDLSSSTSLSPDSIKYVYDNSWDNNPSEEPQFSMGTKNRRSLDGGQPWAAFTQQTTVAPIIQSSYAPSMNGPAFNGFTKVEDVDFLVDPNDSSNPSMFGLGDLNSIPLQSDFSFLDEPASNLMFPFQQQQQKTPYNNGADFRAPGNSNIQNNKGGNIPPRDGFSSVSWQMGSETSSQHDASPEYHDSSGPDNHSVHTASPLSQSQLSRPSISSTKHSNSSSGSDLESEPAEPGNAPSQGKKRKLSDSQDEEPKTGRKARGGSKVKVQPKKTAHNMIEKRYRTNLNDKIAALRDSVPSLRVMAGSSKLGDGEDEDLEGLAPAHKLNKATVLAKATEYIRHLEKRLKRIGEENEELKHQVKTLEAYIPRNVAVARDTQMRDSSSRPGGRMMSRAIIGGLALMVGNGISNPDNSQGNSRGLMAFPMHIPLLSNAYHSGFFSLDGAVLSVIRIVLLFGALLLVVAPDLLDSRPADEGKSAAAFISQLAAAPSLASSLEVRRKAWLTSIQTVWVPRQSLALELAALALKFIKLSLRKMVGWDGYAYIFKTTPEDEAARVKAWLIALDAQLAGGDAEISGRRIGLTFLASLTLPATPYRLMLNALHIRILEQVSWRYGFVKAFAKRASCYFWNEARKMQASLEKTSKGKDTDNSELLPDYLARLVEIDANDVFLDKIVQRACNLAYNLSAEDGAERDEGMDTVVEDFAIRTPLDALAAWYSAFSLRKVLIAALDTSDPDNILEMKETMKLALATAPPSSGTRMRSACTNALLFGDEEGRDLTSVLRDFEAEKNIMDNNISHPSVVIPQELVPRNTAVTVTHDIRIALRCAMALYFLRQSDEESRNYGLNLFKALNCEPRRAIKGKAFTSGMGLLGFVSSLRTLLQAIQNLSQQGKNSEAVENVSGMLRLWVGGINGLESGINAITRRRLTDVCVSLAKRAGGYSESEYEIDAGYGTGSDSLSSE